MYILVEPRLNSSQNIKELKSELVIGYLRLGTLHWIYRSMCDDSF